MNRFELLNENEEIMYEDADVFEPYPNEKIRLKLHTGAKREQLKQSIERSGILTPVIAMPSPHRGKLTIISGGNRVDIANEIGIKVPYQLKLDLTKEQTDLICIDTNLLNRQHDEFLTSELSWLLKTKFDILKHQGRRDDTLRNDCAKLADDYKLKRRSIQYYIRLTNLPEDIMRLVDDNKIIFTHAVAISHLKPEEQSELYQLITNEKIRLSNTFINTLKSRSLESDVNISVTSIYDEINKLGELKKQKINKKTLTKIREIIPLGMDINEFILNAINNYILT